MHEKLGRVGARIVAAHGNAVALPQDAAVGRGLDVGIVVFTLIQRISRGCCSPLAAPCTACLRHVCCLAAACCTTDAALPPSNTDLKRLRSAGVAHQPNDLVILQGCQQLGCGWRRMAATRVLKPQRDTEGSRSVARTVLACVLTELPTVYC